MKLETIHKDNFQDLLKIYKEGQATGLATFETALPSWESWDASHLRFGRIALLDNTTMQAWAALSPVSKRHAYRGVAEISIYVAAKARAKGLGKHLLQELINQSEENQIWTLQAAIFNNNIASIRLHENCGFRKIGLRKKIAQRDGVWFDNILMERRSTLVGI